MCYACIFPSKLYPCTSSRNHHFKCKLVEDGALGNLAAFSFEIIIALVHSKSFKKNFRERDLASLCSLVQGARSCNGQFRGWSWKHFDSENDHAPGVAGLL